MSVWVSVCEAVCVCAHACVCETIRVCATAHVWRLDDNSMQSVFSFHLSEGSRNYLRWQVLWRVSLPVELSWKSLTHILPLAPFKRTHCLYAVSDTGVCSGMHGWLPLNLTLGGNSSSPETWPTHFLPSWPSASYNLGFATYKTSLPLWGKRI